MTTMDVEPDGHPRRGLALLFALLLLALVCVYVLGGRWLGPGEDAAILYSYSENLAATGAISFYPGGPPAEGATDFLWMVMLSGAARLGLDVHLAATLLSAAAHLGIAATLARLAGGNDGRFFLAVAFGLFGLPGTLAAVIGFSPLVFGAFILLQVRWFVERRAAALAWTGLVTSLIRPDGVVFTLPLFAAFLWLEREQRKRALRLFLLCFALPGLAYFAWRLWYFEHWLPLPFYVKSGARDFLGMFEKNALLLNLRYLVLFGPLLGLAFWKLRERPPAERGRVLALGGALLLVPVLFYSTFQLTQNVGERFQYPLALASLALPLVRDDAPRRRRAWFACAGASLLVMLPFLGMHLLTNGLLPLQTATPIARELAGLECGRTMAITQAGRLGYYSRWKCLDLWGLNTPEFTRRAPTAADLAPHAPDLIELHAGTQQYRLLLRSAALPDERAKKDWAAMVQNTYRYAKLEGYETLFVPYVRAAGHERLYAALIPLAARVSGEFDLAKRYGMYLISPRSACRAELRATLEAHGGLTPEAYARVARGE